MRKFLKIRIHQATLQIVLPSLLVLFYQHIPKNKSKVLDSKTLTVVEIGQSYACY